MFNFFSKSKSKGPAKLPFSTDIHCHILPGVDDGSPDIDTSVSLVERMQKWGISRIIASPHVTKATFENTPERLDDAMSQLQSALNDRNLDIDLSHHAEYRLDDFSKSQWDNGVFMTIPGDYIMIENPFVAEAWFIDQCIFDLQVKGFTPILAHPERYSYYFNNRERYTTLHNAGAKFQVNLLSLAGAYGKEQREVAEYLISKNFVDFVGTDLHNHRHADIIDEYLNSKQASTHFAALDVKLLNDSL